MPPHLRRRRPARGSCGRAPRVHRTQDGRQALRTAVRSDGEARAGIAAHLEDQGDSGALSLCPEGRRAGHGERGPEEVSSSPREDSPGKGRSARGPSDFFRVNQSWVDEKGFVYVTFAGDLLRLPLEEARK